MATPGARLSVDVKGLGETSGNSWTATTSVNSALATTISGRLVRRRDRRIFVLNLGNKVIFAVNTRARELLVCTHMRK